MNNEPKQQLVVWWVLWAAFQMGVVMIFFVLGGGFATAEFPSLSFGPWMLGLVPCLVSSSIRWSVLPGKTSAQVALPFFVIGLAMAEATCVLGIFVFPAHRLLLFLVGFLSILQFAPGFAGRYFEGES